MAWHVNKMYSTIFIVYDYLDKSQYESYKSYDITKDFKAGEKSTL